MYIDDKVTGEETLSYTSPIKHIAVDMLCIRGKIIIKATLYLDSTRRNTGWFRIKEFWFALTSII